MADDALRRLLTSSTVLGGELDTRYRVFGLTVEPLAPTAAADPRRQVLFHPVGEFAASLRRTGEDGLEVLTFPVEQLPDVIARFEGTTPAGDPLPVERPNRGAWAPRLSLTGNSGARDGRARHFWLSLAADDLALDLHLTFDVAEVRDAAGNPVEP